jgi:hypothetical protein
MRLKTLVAAAATRFKHDVELIPLSPAAKRKCRRLILHAFEVTVAATQSITRSARNRREDGIVSPSALAVLRLMTKWKVSACSTGISLGFVPLRMRAT